MAPAKTSLYSQIALITTLSSIFILSSASPSRTSTPIHHTPQQKLFKKIYAFGDSYTDTGNTVSTTGPSGFNYVSSLPYGSTFFHHPTNRYSDGRLMIDFVAESLSLPYLPPYLNKRADRSKGVNFAVAGCTAIRHSFFVRHNMTLNITPQSLQTQLKWFSESVGAQGCNGKRGGQCRGGTGRSGFDDALFWVGEIGANDYAYTLGTSVPTSTIQRLAIKSITGFLQEILTRGAKYIVVQGIPTTGCLPLAMVLSPDNDRDDIGCVGSNNKLAYNHNLVLQTKLQQLRKQFPQAVIVYADFWNAYRAIMKSPAKYGMKEPFKACCGVGGGPYNYEIFTACGSPSASSCPNPSQYINWDGVHLTEAMYAAVSRMFLNGSFCRPSFEYLMNRKKMSH